MIVEGDPGIGKSRVVNEWADRAAQPRHVRAFTGRASEIDDATPVPRVACRPRWPARPRDGDRSLGTLQRFLVSFGLKPPASTPSWLRCSDPILSLDLPDNDFTAQMSGEVRADNTLDMFIALLRSASAAGPLMIVLEDVHWLDSASWQLVLRARTELPAAAVRD